MASKAKPYEQFGPYLLFRRLETDSLGDLWRAARMDANAVGPTLALRRLTAGHRTALQQSAAEAKAIVPSLSGSTFVKNQVVDVVDGVPFIAFDYATGRSLRDIVTRARETGGTPLSIELAVLIAERIALSLATTNEMRHSGERLLHGALIPQFVWISDEGDVRVAGQRLGPGLVASVGDPTTGPGLAPYFAPEYRGSGKATKASEVYSLGAILFLLLTGSEPPDAGPAIRSAQAMTREPVPRELRTILEKSLAADAAARYPSIPEMKQAIDLVAAQQPSTTFNLAFYMSTAFKKDFEAEALEREKESKVSVAAYRVATVAAATVEQPAAPPSKSRSAIAAMAVAGVAIAVGAAYFLTRPRTAPPPPAQQPAVVATAPRSEPVLSPPIVASPVPASTAAPAPQTASADPEAARKAFEDAVNQKVQAEMLKLQASFNRDLQQKKSKNAPITTEAPVPSAPAAKPQPAEETAPSAAELDQRRLQAARQETPQQREPAPIVPQSPQPQPAAPQSAPAPAPAPVVAEVREGDVVDVSDLDTPPRALRVPSVSYPAPAVRMRIETSVIVTVLVSETGSVLDVRILRGDPRFGFNDAAMRAVRNMRFSSPMKNGKRVKTWFPQTINFKL
jgi:TonB family protein